MKLLLMNEQLTQSTRNDTKTVTRRLIRSQPEIGGNMLWIHMQILRS